MAKQKPTIKSSITMITRDSQVERLKLSNVTYLVSSANLANSPINQLPEIALVGRSNVGKSSVLNTICNKKKLAFTSKTPGKTRLINFFSVNIQNMEIARLVDLPGYGYARVNKSTKTLWNNNLSEYLLKRRNLLGFVLILDCRHPLNKLDKQLLQIMLERNLKYHVLFNKVDKLKKNRLLTNQVTAIKELEWLDSDFCKNGSFSNFSAQKKLGMSTLIQVFDTWLFS